MKIKSFNTIEQFLVKVVEINNTRYYLIEDGEHGVEVINVSVEDAIDEYMDRIGY